MANEIKMETEVIDSVIIIFQSIARDIESKNSSLVNASFQLEDAFIGTSAFKMLGEINEVLRFGKKVSNIIIGNGSMTCR